LSSGTTKDQGQGQYYWSKWNQKDYGGFVKEMSFKSVVKG